jgi:hypothetical protein
MAYEHKENTGSLFGNPKKETDSQPHKKGDALVAGKMYWVSAWENVSPGGVHYQSLKFTLKEERSNTEFDKMASDVPF